MTREWFTTYCQNAAANVLDKDGKVRFTYIQLKAALDAASRHCVSEIPNAILNLDDNIARLCITKHGEQKTNDNDMYTLLLTLLNIHAAYLMLSGMWKEEPVKEEPKEKDYCGFEIF